MARKLTTASICLTLFAATVLLYWPVRNHELILVDDDEYVSANSAVKEGFTKDSLRTFFTGTGANWMPLTMLSHTLDYKLFGENYGYHHLSSVFFHAMATVFLFLFLSRAIADQAMSNWAAAFVAAVFAFHPLHVESVAWVAERKDVLCALFWFLALLAWVWYLERPGLGRYSLAILAFSLGLMSKPMIVSFPLLLLVLDFWPFRRTWSWWLLIEKLPPLVLCILLSWLTFQLQAQAGAVVSVQRLSLWLRFQNSLLTLLHYAWSTFWPTNLMFGYPFPRQIPWLHTLLAALALLAITVVVAKLRHRYPALLTGSFWYILTVLPVVGLVQVGATGRADRYMYVPMVGLLIMLVQAPLIPATRFPILPRVLAVFALATCLTLAASTRRQITWWHDSETLIRHSLSIQPENDIALQYLSILWGKTPAKLPAAIDAAQQAARLRPEDHQLHIYLSILLSTADRNAEALASAETALRLRPDVDQAWFFAGSASYDMGDMATATVRLRKAISINPNTARPHFLLSQVLQKTGFPPEAKLQLETAVRLAPADAEFRAALGAQLLAEGKTAEATIHLDEAVRLDPEQWSQQYNLGVALIGNPWRHDDAVSHLEAALRLKPGSADIHRGLGTALLRTPGQERRALHHLEAAYRLSPDPALGGQVNELRRRLPPAF